MRGERETPRRMYKAKKGGLKTLLVISGSMDFSTSLQRALRKDYQVQCVYLEEDAVRALMPPPDILLLDLGFRDGNLKEGLKFSQKLRLLFRLRAPIVFLSVENWERLAKDFPLLWQDTAGTYFVKMPFRLNELKETLAAAKPLTLQELRQVGFERCAFGEFCSKLIHDLRNAVRSSKERALAIIKELREVVGFFAPHLKLGKRMRELNRKVANLETASDTQEIENIINCIAKRLSIQVSKPIPLAAQIIAKWRDHKAPENFTHILIADDDDYPAANELSLRGYICRQVSSYEEACAYLERDPPDVLLCDYRLGGDKRLGTALMNAALTEGVFVIMLSGGPIDEPLPPGVEKCEGENKFNALLIHALICERAKGQHKVEVSAS